PDWSGSRCGRDLRAFRLEAGARATSRRSAGRIRPIPDVPFRRAGADQRDGCASAAGPGRRDSGSGSVRHSDECGDHPSSIPGPERATAGRARLVQPGNLHDQRTGGHSESGWDRQHAVQSSEARHHRVDLRDRYGWFETPIPDGEITPLPPPYFLVWDPPQVTFAGLTANVVWAASAPGLIAGATQINAQLPASTNLAAVPVVVILPGVASPPAPIRVVVTADRAQRSPSGKRIMFCCSIVSDCH